MSRLLFFLITAFFLLNSSSVLATVLLDRVVAVVNQEVITWSELYRAMESDASPQLKELKEEERVKVFKQNEAVFLETLVNIKLQLQEAKKLGMSVGDDEVKEAVDSIIKKYGMNEASFKESLAKEGFTWDEYRKRLRDQILISKLVNQQIRNKILVTDSEVKSFLAENKSGSISIGSYRISQILFKKPKSRGEKAKAEEKAAMILQKLKEGEQFSELAKTYSEDPSRAAGGDLGYIRKEQLIKEFSDAIATIKTGEISAPFWTDRGLHIIRLDEKEEMKDINEVNEEAKKAITNKLFNEKYSAWIKTLRERSFIEVRL